MTTTDTTHGLGERDGLRWWPSALGLLIAVGAGIGSEGADMAVVIAVAALVYVGAAAAGSGRAAWWWFLATFPVITVGQVFDAPEGTTWVCVAIAAVAAVWGITRGRWDDPGGLPLQSVAMVAFAAVSLVAFMLDATVGAWLVAAGLVAHGIWDVYHHRTNRVVVRSYAEACAVIDFAIPVFIVVNTVS